MVDYEVKYVKKIMIAMSCCMVAYGEVNGSFIEESRKHNETYTRIIQAHKASYDETINVLGRAILRNFKKSTSSSKTAKEVTDILQYIFDLGKKNLEQGNFGNVPFFHEFLSSPFRIFSFSSKKNKDYSWNFFKEGQKAEINKTANKLSDLLLAAMEATQS